jgi:hypothetical protein
MSMMFRRFSIAAVVLVLVCAVAGCPAETRLDIGKAERVADGVLLYRISNPRLLDVPGPIAVQLLRLEPSKVRLRSALALDRVMALETVPALATRTRAIAAINAGFFVVKNGDPAGVLEVADELVSETGIPRGAVGIMRPQGQPTKLVFDRLSASVALRYQIGTEAHTIPIDGIDTTRVRGKLMLYTPRFGPDSDTAPTGVEWQLDGTPRRVTEVRLNQGKTPIPRSGAVLSFGGTVLPTALEQLRAGQTVLVEPTFQSAFGTLPETWVEAADIVGGAGLLVHKGKPIPTWTDERLHDGFTAERHPRTMVGVSKSGTIWLVTVDGRNPAVSIGMTFADLQRLAANLNLYYALNLDGGGSTTMVVNGTIANHPSDAAGPRRVSDCLVVTRRDDVVRNLPTP